MKTFIALFLGAIGASMLTHGYIVPWYMVGETPKLTTPTVVVPADTSNISIENIFKKTTTPTSEPKTEVIPTATVTIKPLVKQIPQTKPADNDGHYILYTQLATCIVVPGAGIDCKRK